MTFSPDAVVARVASNVVPSGKLPLTVPPDLFHKIEEKRGDDG